MRIQPDQLDTIEETLVNGIKDFMKRTHFTRAHLGLSGGIDSALVAPLAARALGAANVQCFSMPSRYSSQGSVDDAVQTAANLGCNLQTLPIEETYAAFLRTLQPVFQNRPFDLAEENLQARIRGVLLMAYSNKFNSLLFTTGNKSEIAMGYCTLYGDTAGALAPIGSLYKTEVFALCRRINQRVRADGGADIIPQAVIDKPPSAELRPNQKDEDSLPPYDTLDKILWFYQCEKLPRSAIIAQGWDSVLVDRILTASEAAAHKRRQMPPVLEV